MNRRFVGLCNLCNKIIYEYVTIGARESLVQKDGKSYHKKCLDEIKEE